MFENVWMLVLGFVVIDVVSGILKSIKERTIKSATSYKGLVKKVGLFVALAFLMLCDEFFETGGTLETLGVTLIVTTEAMSILENLNAIGISLPFVDKYFANFTEKDDEK